MIVRQETVCGKQVSITFPAYNGLYFIEMAEKAPDWCYPWEVREDGMRPCMYKYATNRKQADLIFSEMVTREKMNAERRQSNA